MRVVTLNVRNPSFNDGPHSWDNRREAFFETLRRLDPDVLCLQETYWKHAQEVLSKLDLHGAIGQPREEGEFAEMCAIVVQHRENVPRSEEGAVSDWGTEWLSETPDVPGSLGWDAVCPRVVTWVANDTWALLNVHLDHVGQTARENGMAQVVARADALGKPCLIVGDLNTTPDEPALAIAKAAGFADLADGTGPTYHGFGKEPEIRIDYVLARGPWACTRAWVERGEYSDHWAVVVDLELVVP